MRYLLASFLVVSFGFTTSPAGATPEVRRVAVMSSAAEVALATAAALSERGRVGEFLLSWEIEYSPREWVLRLSGENAGQPVSLTIAGYLWGGETDDWRVQYSGMGQLGDERVTTHGEAHWIFDPEASDHTAMDFRQIIKFGENSLWDWFVGAEAVTGGAIGAAGAIMLSPATGGASALLGIKAAIKTATAVVTLSTVVQYALKEDDGPPPIPNIPERPSPEPGEFQGDDEDAVIVVVANDGQMRGRDIAANLALSGQFDHADRFANGTIVLQRE